VQKGRLDFAARRKTEEYLKNFNLQLQKQVKEKARQLTGVFERITDGFIALDKDFCFTYVNKRAGEMTSRDPDSFIGKNIWIEFDKNISPQFRDAITKAIKQQEYVYFEEYSPAYDCWFEDHLYPSPEGLSIFYRDISERKKTAEEKEKIHYLLNERVKELTTLYRVGQILQTKERPVDSLLQEIVSILPGGWQYSEICAARIILGESEFRTPNFADGIYKQSATFEFADIKGRVEIVYLEERPAETEGPFVAEERNLINMVAEMLQVYFVRKRAVELIVKEKNLSDSVINSLPGIFYFYDRSGKFIRWNKRFETAAGYSSEEIGKMNKLDFFEGEDREIIKKCIDDVFEKGGSNAEAWFLSKDKRKTPYYFTGTSIEIDDILYSIGIGTDMTERKKAEEELRISKENLKRSYEEIRQLASNIENIREEEKIKIAREIHDELGQQLTGLKMDVSWLAKKLNPEQAILQEKTKEILSLLDETVRSVRRIASELRPGLLDDLGLVAAMEWQSEEFEKRFGIKVDFISSFNDAKIPSRIATGFFRIYQESLTNVARHSQAHQIIAALDQKKDEIVLQISDDGKGFDGKDIENKKTLGLLGMKERTMMMGGRYEINSKPGEGTTVIVAVPLEKSNDHEIKNN
jgi:PAS domain S-box-containing protein